MDLVHTPRDLKNFGLRAQVHSRNEFDRISFFRERIISAGFVYVLCAYELHLHLSVSKTTAMNNCPLSPFPTKIINQKRERERVYQR